ncbi:MAG: hypothetical protein A2V88_04815 [Elusimicrobia bacterium RBG_16_66_12]|nr:MAG: hypothetical protein A2V88_04815 [Elusimicrobia bacterium RBG_16_66_12]
MPKDDAKTKYYQELNLRGGELSVRYQKAAKAGKPRTETEPIADEIFEVVTALAFALLGDKVRRSRQSLSGVPSNMDENDLLQDLQCKIFSELEAGKYTDEGHFKAWVLTIANNIFLDSLNYKKSKKERPDAKKDAEEPADADSLARRGESTAKHLVESLEAMVGHEPGVREDSEGSLCDREVLNLILEGLRSVGPRPGVEVWTARAFLGKDEDELLELYGLKPDTSTSHFRRISLDILAYINQHEGYKDVSLKGLRQVVAQPLLEERDLALIADERQREALRLSVLPEMTISRMGELMGLSATATKKTLQAAIVALSQAKVRRAVVAVPSADGPGLDAWLWSEVGGMLAAYPEPLAQVRGGPEPSAADGELAALCQVAIMLAYSCDGIEPPKGFGELTGPRIQKDGLDATAHALGLQRPALIRILAGSVGPEQLDSALLGKLASHFGMEPIKVAAALRIGTCAAPGGRTRGLTPREREQYVASVRRRVMNRIRQP